MYRLCIDRLAGRDSHRDWIMGCSDGGLQGVHGWRPLCLCATPVDALRSVGLGGRLPSSASPKARSLWTTDTILAIVRKAHKSGSPVFVASPGVCKASDQVEAKAVERAIVDHAALAWAIAAAPCELVDYEAWPIMGLPWMRASTLEKGGT